MGLVLQLVETRADGGTRSVELMKLGRPGNLHDIADLGLTLPEAKQLLACVSKPSSPCKPAITRRCGRTARAAASGSASRIGGLAGSQPCSARWWYGCPGSAVRAAVAARRGLTGPRTAAQPRAGSAASTPVRAHDVPRRRRRAGPLAASRGRNE